jgi:hypothetical protein
MTATTPTTTTRATTRPRTCHLPITGTMTVTMTGSAAELLRVRTVDRLATSAIREPSRVSLAILASPASPVSPVKVVTPPSLASRVRPSATPVSLPGIPAMSLATLVTAPLVRTTVTTPLATTRLRPRPMRTTGTPATCLLTLATILR